MIDSLNKRLSNSHLIYLPYKKWTYVLGLIGHWTILSKKYV